MDGHLPGWVGNSNLLKRLFFRFTRLTAHTLWERSAYPTWLNLNVGLPVLVDWIFRDTAVLGIEYNPSWYGANIEDNPGFPGLELVEVAEVLVGARNLEKANCRWHKLLAPLEEIEPFTWAFESGPRLRLVRSSQDQIAGMVWRVRSLNRAAQFLHQADLLGSENQQKITLAPEKIMGLNIQLIV